MNGSALYCVILFAGIETGPVLSKPDGTLFGHHASVS